MVSRKNTWKWLAAAGAAVLALTVLAGSALAAAPSATTGPTTAVGSTTATVTGSVDPGGQATTWDVEYGTSTSYGSKTASKSTGSGTAAVDVSAALTGLKAGTTYHYRVVATNGAGTSRGTDAVFTTTVPPDVTTGTASGITASAATLNGTVDPNSRDTTFYFEYGTSTSYGTKTSAKSAGSATTARAESAAVSGLQTGRVYHFRIVASSDAGTTTGKDSTFTTSSAPAVVTDDASSVTPTSATLRGSVSPNGLSTTRWFEYGTTTGYGSKTSSVSAGSGAGATSVSAAVKNLKAATTYHFRLVAQNSSGKTFGADKTFATVGAPAAQTAAAQGRRPRHRRCHRHARHQGPFDDVVVRLRHVDQVRQGDLVEERGLQGGPAEGERDADRPDAGHDLSLPAGREERRRHDLRRGRDVHDRGRDSHDARTAGRLRRACGPVGNRPDASDR